MNFGVVQSPQDLVGALEQLKARIDAAVGDGELPEDAGTDASYQVTKAIQDGRKPDPDKPGILDHLKQAKGCWKAWARRPRCCRNSRTRSRRWRNSLSD